MIYIAFDQASKTTGFAIFNDKQLVFYNHFNVNSSNSMEKRLTDFKKKVEEVLDSYNQEKVKVCFEDIQQQGGNVKTFKTLAYIQAILILVCGERNLDYEILSPSHWRKVLTDNCGVKFGTNRTVQKGAAAQFVQEKFGVTATEDESDAICLGFASTFGEQNAW